MGPEEEPFENNLDTTVPIGMLLFNICAVFQSIHLLADIEPQKPTDSMQKMLLLMPSKKELKPVESQQQRITVKTSDPNKLRKKVIKNENLKNLTPHHFLLLQPLTSDHNTHNSFFVKTL